MFFTSETWSERAADKLLIVTALGVMIVTSQRHKIRVGAVPIIRVQNLVITDILVIFILRQSWVDAPYLPPVHIESAFVTIDPPVSIMPTRLPGHAGTPRHDPFAPPTPSQTVQERRVLFTGRHSQPLRQPDGSPSKSSYSASHGAQGSGLCSEPALSPSACTARCGSEARQRDVSAGQKTPTCVKAQKAQEPNASEPDEHHAVHGQQGAIPQIPHIPTALTFKRAKTSSGQLECAQAPASKQHPAKRLGPMQAAKLALARTAVEPEAIQMIPRKRSYPSSQPCHAAGSAVKRIKGLQSREVKGNHAAKCDTDSMQHTQTADSAMKRTNGADEDLYRSEGASTSSMQHSREKAAAGATGKAALQQHSSAWALETSSCRSHHVHQAHLSIKARISPGAVCAKCEKAIPAATATDADAWACR